MKIKKYFSDSKYLFDYSFFILTFILLLSFFTDFLLENLNIQVNVKPLQRTLYWVAGFSVIIYILILLKPKKINKIKISLQLSNWLTVVLILILIFSFLIRIQFIKLFPLNRDEIFSPLYASEQFKCGFGENSISAINSWKWFYYGFIPVISRIETYTPIFSMLTLVSTSLFSDQVFGVRIISIIISMITVFLTYMLSKEMYNRKVALLAAFLFLFLPWFFIESIIGLDVILIPFFAVLIFYFLFKGIKSKNKLLIFISSILMGISLYSYFTAYIFLIMYFLLVLILRKQLKFLSFKDILLMFLIILFFAYPVFVSFKSNLRLQEGTTGHYFFVRTIFRDAKSTADLFPLILNRLKTSLIALLVNSDSNILYGKALREPLLGWLSLFLVPLSVAYAFKRHNISDKILLTWFFVSLIITGSLTAETEGMYLFVILPVPLILVSKFVIDLKSKFISLFLILILILSSGFSIFSYVNRVSSDPEEMRWMSYGSKEVQEYLTNSFKGLNVNVTIFSDKRIIPQGFIIIENEKILCTTDSKFIPAIYYFDEISDDEFIKLQTSSKNTNQVYIFWSSNNQTQIFHSLEKYSEFRRQFPDLQPAKIIYYPNGIPAIEIYVINR